ncbi:MAG: PulJ/GspJ family protein [Candidatus Rifleibacteriota bacterium]
MYRQSRKTKAVTLVEIMIATFVLSIFITSIFMVFRSSSKSFSSGAWRVQNQKRLQVFLARLKDLLEKANNAHSIGTEGTLGVETLPISINDKVKDTDFEVRGQDLDLMFFAITESYKEGQPDYGVAEKTGSWLGVALLCRGDKLILKAEGDWDEFASDCAPPATLRPADMANFPGRDSMNLKMTLNDVESVSISTPDDITIDKETGHMRVKVTLRRYDGKRKTDSRIVEEIGVSLIEKDPEVTTF